MYADTTMLRRPPFAVVGSLGPVEVGAEIAECFRRLEGRSNRLEFAHLLTTRRLGFSDHEPIVRAGKAIARDVDRGVGAGTAHGYHNGQHLLEVMLCALYLSRLASLDARRVLRVVTAALVHDFHHDGSKSAAEPFRQESAAIAQARPYLHAAGVEESFFLELQALVLATEFEAGATFARQCWAQHLAERPVASPRPPLPRALQPLCADASLAMEAVLLAEADLLPSIGLSYKHSANLQARLATEWGTSLGCADKLRFIDHVIASISVATFFLPSIRAVEQQYLEICTAGTTNLVAGIGNAAV
jgi:hypothetical protein